MSKAKSLVVLWVLFALGVSGTIILLSRKPETWRPPFLSGARSTSVDRASIARENPFRIPTGPNSSQVVESDQVSARDYYIEGDFDQVVAKAKDELTGWQMTMAGNGRLGTQYAATMDQVFTTKLRAVKVYRVQVGRMTRVRVWHRYPSHFELRSMR